MNNIIIKTIGICIIVSLLIPVTVGLKCDSDDTNASTDSFIVISLSKFDDDGYLVFTVRNYAIKDLDNATMLIHFRGWGWFTTLNKVDVNTELFVEHLPIGEERSFKTKDQVFKVRPLFRRPLIPFFSGKMTLAFNECTRTSSIMKMLAFTYRDVFEISYP